MQIYYYKNNSFSYKTLNDNISFTNVAGVTVNAVIKNIVSQAEATLTDLRIQVGRNIGSH